MRCTCDGRLGCGDASFVAYVFFMMRRPQTMPSEIIFLVTGGSGDNETAPRGASSTGVRYGANKKTALETRAVWFRGNLVCLKGGGGSAATLDYSVDSPASL